MIADSQFPEVSPPGQRHEWVLGCGANFVPRSGAHPPYGLYSAADNPQYFSGAELKLRIACQRILKTRFATENILDGHPSARIGIDDSRISNDTFREAILPEP
jgi:hypothetical protein